MIHFLPLLLSGLLFVLWLFGGPWVVKDDPNWTLKWYGFPLTLIYGIGLVLSLSGALMGFFYACSKLSP